MSRAKSKRWSEDYDGLCNSIHQSPKVNGYSLLAVELLLAAVRAHRTDEQKTRQEKQTCLTKLEYLYPVDYWCLMHDKRVNNRSRLLELARSRLQTLRRQEKCIYMTFEGERMRVGRVTYGVEYILAKLPEDVWDHPVTTHAIYEDLKRYRKSILTYGQNEVIFEVG